MKKSLAGLFALSVLLPHFASAGQPFCVADFYASIQQGNSNLLPANPDPWRWNHIAFYRSFINDERLAAVKIWDGFYGPGNPQVTAIMQDPTIDIVVYRPLMNESHSRRRENADYGMLATQFYNHYGSIEKIVILTGWEQDHQYQHYHSSADTQWDYNDYRAFVQQRQNGVEAARATYGPSSNLFVFHAVEVNAVPGGVLHNVVRLMDPKPDFVSYSAWGGLYDLTNDLNAIEQKSGLDRTRIYIGEFAYQGGEGITTTSHNRVRSFLQEARAWGVHLAFLWQFNQGQQFEKWVVYAEPEHSLRPGYVSEGGRPVARATIDAVRTEDASLDKVCSLWPFVGAGSIP
jgi:hypothetical protein